MDFVSKLDFLDTETALSLCRGDTDFYKEILLSYCKGCKIEEMQKYSEEGDYENYRILVHALKSMSKSIGATELSEKARLLEEAAKNGDGYYIESHHLLVAAEYRMLVKKISAVFGVTPDNEMKRIVVIDDDVMSLRIADKILGKKYKMRCIKSCTDAITYLSGNSADLVLLDVNMPEMNGFEVIEKLKASEKTKNIPVIFLTGDEDEEVSKKGIEAGAVDFIKKPFAALDMLSRIENAIVSKK